MMMVEVFASAARRSHVEDSCILGAIIRNGVVGEKKFLFVVVANVLCAKAARRKLKPVMVTLQWSDLPS